VFYGEDLARVHHEGFGSLARAAAWALVERLRLAGIRDGLVVDLACGSGITAELLTAAGYDVLGVDLSPHLLEIARRRAPAARFEQASVFDAELPPCVAVACIGEGLSYAADERAGRAAVRAVLTRAHAALAPRGVLLFDVVEPGRERLEHRRSWTDGDGWVVCVEAWEDEAHLLQRRITTFLHSAADGGWRRSDEHHVQHQFERDDVLADLAAAGFDAEALPGYGHDHRFGRGHAGFAAVRRA
jgi:SAM-dependent methyltransferase